MQDKLEKFVEDYKSEFETLTPKESLWEGIYNGLEKSKRATQNLFLWKVAAVLLFVLSIGLTFYINKDILTKQNAVTLSDKEFLTTEKYYTTVINDRQQLIKIVAQTYPVIEMDFEQDWKTLDKSYKILKDEYKTDKSDEIRNALIQNLRLRVSLLNKQLQVLESIEKDKPVVKI